MAITAAQVKELREATGAGMMDAKKALTETDGDMDAAVDWLRTKGLAKAAKKSGRVAAEGLVAVAVNNGRGTRHRCAATTTARSRTALAAGSDGSPAHPSAGRAIGDQPRSPRSPRVDCVACRDRRCAAARWRHRSGPEARRPERCADSPDAGGRWERARSDHDGPAEGACPDPDAAADDQEQPSTGNSHQQGTAIKKAVRRPPIRSDCCGSDQP